MNRMKPRTASAVLGLMGAAALLICACTTANIGSVRNSRETTRAFAELQVNTDYRYWYLNQENAPYGVAGIDREYRIEGPMWQAVDPQTPVFRKVVELVRDFPTAGRFTSGFSDPRPAGAHHRRLVLESWRRDHGRPGGQGGLDRDRVALDGSPGAVNRAMARLHGDTLPP